MEQQIDEKLQKAAEEYCCKVNHRLTSIIIESFIAGALRQRNSIWHDASEEPEKEDVQILVVFNGEWTYVRFYHKHDKRFYDNGKPKFFLHEIDKWCYVSDILPTKD